MKPISKPFAYHSAEVSRKPGYLAKRFADIRKQQKAQSELPTAKVITTFLLKSKGGKL